jgi:superfamily I DNA and/or RNA helicase
LYNNVGLTRAKEKLICVGDLSKIKRGKILSRFAADIASRGNVIIDYE